MFDLSMLHKREFIENKEHNEEMKTGDSVSISLFVCNICLCDATQAL